mmetsp:Transcript_39561/g.88014  ORF Transcript_39561/g.88014 Transcript_39561/m.88014 type:complete len:263 (-) Transcript_39561:381-1169(-)
MDGASTTDNAGDTFGSEGDVAQQHTGVDGPVVNTLLGLVQQHLLEQVPRDILHTPVSALQSLVDGHSAHGDRAVAQHPLACLLDVVAGGEVHDGVGAPDDGPLQLLNLLLNGACHGTVADVGIDLGQEVAADDSGLQLQMALVGRDDGAAAGDLTANKLRVQVLAGCHILHLLGDDALLGIVLLGLHLVTTGVTTSYPVGAQLGQSLPWVHALGSRSIVNVKVIAVGQLDAAEGNLQDLLCLLVHGLLEHLRGPREAISHGR